MIATSNGSDYIEDWEGAVKGRVVNSDFKKSGKGGGGGLNSLVSLTKDFPFFMTYLWGASRFCWLMLGKGQTKITF